VRLLFTNPYFWPYVRRGSERAIHDLSVVMAQRGHEVRVVTRHPGRGVHVRRDDGFEVEYRPTSPTLNRLLRRDYLESFSLTAARAVIRHPADVYHAFYPSDSYGLYLGTRLRKRPFIFSWHGIPQARWWADNHPRTHRMYLRAMPGAARITVMTNAAAQRMREDYNYDPVVIAPGTFVDDFQQTKVALPRPVVVCAAAVDDGRKRMDLLIDAFEVLVKGGRDVALLLIGSGDPALVKRHIATKAPDVASRIDVRPPENVDDIPGIYAGCTVGALTSVNEAFGLVVVEYLAAGMPAVVSDDGGSPEILAPGTGFAFRSGDVAECASALGRALELAVDPATEARCRERARDYDWSVRGDAYEELYRDVLA
jgi:glycosyltransferase involved in cell wall biosynthesis